MFLEAEYSITDTLFNSIILLKNELTSYLCENQGSLQNNPEQNRSDSEKNKTNEEDSEESKEKDPVGKQTKTLSLTQNTFFNLKTSSIGSQSIDSLCAPYLKEVEARLKFIRILKNQAYEQLELRHAKLLWDLLVENAICESERNTFFSLFNSITYYANGKCF